MKLSVLSMLLIIASGSTARDGAGNGEKAPLTAVSLAKARKQCRISDAMLVDPSTIRFSGLQEIGKPMRNYAREWACLEKKLQLSNARWIIG